MFRYFSWKKAIQYHLGKSYQKSDIIVNCLIQFACIKKKAFKVKP